jgi:hypothetical protein
MNTYLFKYSCPRWYGVLEGVQNLYSEKEGITDDIINQEMLKSASKISGSQSCKVELLLKYKISIESTQPCKGITEIPFNKF